MFDYFKYLGDICHLFSFIVLISNMKEKKSCLGLSYRTQELYLMIFLVRYSDVLFLPQSNKWNLTLKFLFTGATIYVIYLMRYQKPICVSYEAIVDKFPHRITILPSKQEFFLKFASFINSGLHLQRSFPNCQRSSSLRFLL